MATTDPTRELLAQLYTAFSTGNASAWIDNLADDVIGVGSDPGEWWEGRDRTGEILTTQLQEMSAAGIRVLPGSAKIKSAGDTVWAVDRPVVQLSDGTEVPMRLTLVTTEEGETACIRHFHLSVGATNEAVVGEELTIE